MGSLVWTVKRHAYSLVKMEGLNFRLAFVIAAGAFGSAFQHGYNTGVLNAPQTLVMDWMMNCTMTQAEEGKEAEKVCVMTEEEGVLIWSWIVATFCVGGIISGIFLFAAKYAGSWEMLIIGRLVIGVNSGLNA